ncbi:hypothetical protein MFLAVUS_002976 [Mucor flavus]|uniref:Uncharacterized protein n=1 Tax=Mucor flavus TaxID=439312 RepID=A0ABP9YRT3_9FUNG
MSRLPFMLVCNDIFHYTWHEKFKKKPLPLTKPSTLLSLKLDAPTIFSIVSSPNVRRPMNLYNFNNEVIRSRNVATESKNAVFGSFFNLNQIETLSRKHGLIFAHNMMLVPGCKTLRVNGYLKKIDSQSSKLTTSNKDTKRNATIAEAVESKQIKMIRQAEVDALRRQLQNSNAKKKDFFLKNNFRDLKKQWITKDRSGHLTSTQNDHNSRLYEKIRAIKAERNRLDNDTQQAKGKLAANRQLMFNNIINTDLQRTEADTKFVISEHKYKGMEKAENCRIDSTLLNSGKITFSGTDNDSHTPASNLDTELLKIPKSFRIYSRDVDYGSGNRSYREALEREKKKHDVGIRILKIESKMAKNSIDDVTSANEVDNWKKAVASDIDTLRDFYYSPKRNKKKRTKEFKKRKYIDRLCEKERYHVSPLKDVKKIMFIGDRGYGIGSRLKGFNHCGSIWKPKQHSRLGHPFKRIKDKQGLEKVKTVNGSFICYNQSCPSVYLKQSAYGRDSLSAAAIAFSGACSVILGMPCPHFNPNISQINTDDFNHIATFFCKGNKERPTVDDE